MAKLEGRVALITGAAQGMGAAEATRLVEEGAEVVLCDILDEKGEALSHDLGSTAHYEHLDVRHEADWSSVATRTAERFGGIDVLVNNAGIVAMSPLLETSSDDARRIFDVNFFGTFNGMRAVAPIMVGKGHGSIINIGSLNGFMGSPGLTVYCGTKHAILGLTRAAAMELGRDGVRVNVVCPGAVNTTMGGGATEGSDADPLAALGEKIPLGKPADPEEIAGIVVFLASDDSGYCNGGVFTVDGGLSSGFTIF